MQNAYADDVVLWTAVEAARCAADELQSGGGPGAAYRCLLQLLDDYRRARRADGTAAAARLFADEPPGTGDVRVDAALARLAEHLARLAARLPEAWCLSHRVRAGGGVCGGGCGRWTADVGLPGTPDLAQGPVPARGAVSASRCLA